MSRTAGFSFLRRWGCYHGGRAGIGIYKIRYSMAKNGQHDTYFVFEKEEENVYSNKALVMYKTARLFSYIGLWDASACLGTVSTSTVYLFAHYRVEMDYSRKNRVLEFPCARVPRRRTCSMTASTPALSVNYDRQGWLSDR